MKIVKALIFIIVLQFAQSLHAQKESLYADGMTWITTNFSFDGGEPTEMNETIFYIVQGDSTIDGVKYKIINSYYHGKNDDSKYYWDTYLARYSNGKYLFYLPWDKEYMKGYFIGPDFVLFDENLTVGDTLFGNPYERIEVVGDTSFTESPTIKRKYWKILPYSSSSGLYTEILDCIWWVEGIGQLVEPVPTHINEYDCPCYNMLTCCINPKGDTIYKNDKYLYFGTLSTLSLTANEIDIIQSQGGCTIVAETVTGSWSAALYNSSGICVAQKTGEGSELFLPTTGKGTHILAVKVGGKVLKKKIALK